MNIPERGDIVWINFSPHAGHEQAGKRPALILSWSDYNRLGLCWTVPITTRSKGFPFEIKLPATVKKVQGYILADQIRCFDWHRRHLQHIERGGEALVEQVVKRAECIYMA